MDRGQFLESVRGLREEGNSIRAVASELGVHPSRVQRALKVLSQKRQDKPVDPAGSSMSAGFVGRQQEMSELSAALDNALAGRGRLVMLAGQPGIGKTRTSQELALIAEERGAHVLWGRCYEGQGAPPYWPPGR